MKYKYYTILFASIMAMLAFTARSDDNEPKEDTLSGEEMVAWVNEQLGNKAEAGKLYTNEMGEYIITVDSKEESRKFCETLIRKTWDGKNTTIQVPDNNGTISLSDASNQGAYYLSVFRNFCKTEKFSLHVASQEYLDCENIAHLIMRPSHSWPYYCKDCKTEFYCWKRPSECPYCKSKNVEAKGGMA